MILNLPSHEKRLGPRKLFLLVTHPAIEMYGLKRIKALEVQDTSYPFILGMNVRLLKH